MSPEDIEYFLKYNEGKDSPPQRLLLTLENSYAVILLNDHGLLLLPFLNRLDGHQLRTSSAPAFTVNVLLCELTDHAVPIQHEENYKGKPKAWVVHYDGSTLLIPIQGGSVKTNLPTSIGIVITGKENLLKSTKVLGVRLLSKDEATPFIVDKWGDSWNDDFDLEPRIIDSVPSTVFSCVEGIMDAAKRAFNASEYESSVKKYQKAFHYCHKYYPDDMHQDDLEKATNLKMKSLLNLALVSLKIQTPYWFHQCIDACDIVLGMPECQGSSSAKAFYRRGKARLALGDDVEAKKDFILSLSQLEDPQSLAAIHECEKVEEARKKGLRQKLKKAFS